MNITIVIGAFLPVPTLSGGAVEKMWYALGKEFARLGHNITIISKKHNELPLKNFEQNLQHIRVKGYETPKSGLILKLMDLLYSRRVLKTINADADIIITNTFWIPLIADKALKSKMVVDVARMPKGQMKYYKGVSSLRANSGIVESAIKNELKNRYQIPLFTIPNPLPFAPTQNVNVYDKEKTILYVGRIDPEKGIHLLIEAFIKLNKWKLKIVGPWDTEYGGGGEKYYAKLKILIGENENIELTGPVFDDQKLQKEYAKAAIFVYPSLAEKGETFGIAPLEAMAWGCVPIVSNLQCFHDFIKNEHNGLVFDHRQVDSIDLLSNKINFLIEQEETRTNLATNALDVRTSHATSTISAQFITQFKVLTK